jgi:CHASE3 domain sensor protein
VTNYLVVRANMLVFGALAAALLLLVGGLTWERLTANQVARQLVQHTNAVIESIKDLNIAVHDAETGQRGYLLTGSDDYLAPYQSALDKVGFLQGELQRLTSDDPEEQQRLRDLSPVLQRKLAELAQTVQLRRDIGFDAALRVVRSDIGREYMKQVEAVLASMTSHEQSLLNQRLLLAEGRSTWVQWLVAGGTVLAIAVGGPAAEWSLVSLLQR